MRFLRRAAVGLALLLLIAVVAVWGLGTASLPRTSGTVDVSGLQAPVTIRRDGRGVPEITADTPDDGWFALGYVHAQDRLFQLDMHRRLAAGRLSEVIGAATIGIDRRMRTLGFTQAARSSLEVLDDQTKRALEAYAAGINAGRASLSVLPPEYLLLGIDFAPWEPLDSLVFARLMAFRLSGNWRQEALNAALLEHLGAERYSALKRLGGSPGVTTIAAMDGLGPALHQLAADWPTEARPLTASNWWMVDAAHSAGGALLANDPHLELQAPIQWYLARLRLGDTRIDGATMPAIPFPLVGHNDRIAWGLTTTHSDTADLVVETESPGGAVLTPDGPALYVTRQETIAVKDGEAVTFEVRETPHGPVVTDLVDLALPEGRVVALQAAALAPADHTADAMARLPFAQDRAGAHAALMLFHAPQQNIALVGADGSIGFIAPGRVPLRGKGDGTLPRPGHLAEWQWQGWLPFDVLPQITAPADGLLVNANNRPVPEDWPAFLGATFPPPYRAARITERLAALEIRDAAAMATLQTDARSLPFAALKPHLQTLAPSPQRDMLLAWDGDMRADRPEPLLFMAVLLETERAVFGDDLGVLYVTWGGHRPRELFGALADATGAWCGAPGCRDELAHALAGATESLQAEFGAEMRDWRWGEAHRARLSHSLFRRIPLLAEITSLARPADGGPYTINRADLPGGPPGAPWRQRLADRHGPGLRFVVDMAHPESAAAIIATGQSGHPLSRHYGDQAESWQAGRLEPLRRDDAGEGETLRLEPLRSTR